MERCQILNFKWSATPQCKIAQFRLYCRMQVELVEPPSGAAPGERVMVAGFAAEPVAVLKKEAFDSIASGLRTNADRVACYNGAPLQTSQGVCTVKSIADGGIR